MEKVLAGLIILSVMMNVVFLAAIFMLRSAGREKLRQDNKQKREQADVLTMMAVPMEPKDLSDGSYQVLASFGVNSLGSGVYAFLHQESMKILIDVCPKGYIPKSQFTIKGGKIVDWSGYLPIR